MPYEIRLPNSKGSASANVLVSTGVEEKPVTINFGEVGHSQTMTHDMRSQERLGYISLRFVEALPEGVSYDMDQMGRQPQPGEVQPNEQKEEGFKPTGDELDAMRAELKSMKKDELQNIAVSLGVDPDMSKDKLVEAVLKAQASQKKE